MIVASRDISTVQALKNSWLTPALRASSLTAQQRAALEIVTINPGERDWQTGHAALDCPQSGRLGRQHGEL